VNDRELKEFLEWIEIAIPMQQGVLLAEAKRLDKAIDRLEDRMTATPERSVVARGVANQVDAAGLEDLELEQLPLDSDRSRLVANTLKHFADDQIRDAKPLPIELRIEPVRLRVPDAAEVIDPDRGVDDDHDELLRDSAAAGPLEITLPGLLASEASDAPLAARLDEQALTFLCLLLPLVARRNANVLPGTVRDSNDLWELTLSSGRERSLTRFTQRSGGLGGMAMAVSTSHICFTWRNDVGDIWVMDVVPDEEQ
jgi:hypothetical protein